MKIIKLAIRSILHFRTYSGINLLGLALSLACVITIFRYVYGEFTVDRFNKNIDRIYVTTLEISNNPGNIKFSGLSNPNMETTFVDLTEHPGVEMFSHFMWYDNEEIDTENRKYNATILMADSNFLKITDYPVISGVERLSDPQSALITKNLSQKIFGNENPVGKTFRHSTGKILTITGIIGQTSTKATLSFDIVVSYLLANSWSSRRISQTFVQLYPGVDYRTINKQYEDFFEMRSWQQQLRYQLFPLSKVYFDKNIVDVLHIYKKGNFDYVAVFIIVGVLILLVGIISYINIYTVVILRRGRELCMKKILGAEGHNVFVQLMIENILMTGLAFFIALVIVNTAQPFVSNVLQLDQNSNILFDILLSLGLLFILPVFITLYPFFRHHFSTPVNSLHHFKKIRGDDNLRTIFLSFQYVITIVMIVVSLFFIKQLRFMLNADPNYHTKEIVKVQFLKNDFNVDEQEKIMQILDEIAQKMNACPLFLHWTYGKSPNQFSKGGFYRFKLPDGDFKEISLNRVSESWFRLFDIQLKEGRLWDDNIDVSDDYLMIVTESALKYYGVTDFNNALLQPEKRLWYSGKEMNTNPPYRIVGVVKDFNFLHLSLKAEPVAFLYEEAQPDYPLIAAIVPGRTQDAIEFLRTLHEETVGGEFSHSFVEDEIREMYKGDKKIASIYSAFTFFAIFISVLGLLSISLFDLQQRRKEIAIRKINGASFSNIIRLLLKKYFWSLGISFVIATPVALFAINRYLEDFAHKATVSWWLFALAITLTAGISLLTLIIQTQKAANQNPAETIKNND